MTDVAELISVGAMEIVARAQSLGIAWSMRMATVVESIAGTVIAQYDGDPKQINMASLLGPLPVAKRVYVLEVPPAGNYICGLVTEAPLALNCECTNVFGMTAGTTTSASYVTMPGTPTVLFDKLSDTSRLGIDLAGTFFSTTLTAGIVAGVNLGAAGDFNVTALTAANPSLNSRCTYAGHLIIDPLTVSGGLPAGPYSIIGVWRRNNAVGTLNVDIGDVWSCKVMELPASI